MPVLPRDQDTKGLTITQALLLDFSDWYLPNLYLIQVLYADLTKVSRIIFLYLSNILYFYRVGRNIPCQLVRFLTLQYLP